MKLFVAISELLRALLSMAILIFAVCILAIGFVIALPFILIEGLISNSKDTKNGNDSNNNWEA